MVPVVDQLNAICQANAVATRQFAAISLDSTENIVKSALDTAQKLIDDDNPLLSAIWANTGLPGLLTDWSHFYQENVQKVLEITRTYIEDAAKVQSEFTRLIESQVTNANSSLVESVQEFANAPLAIKETNEALERQKSRKVTV